MEPKAISILTVDTTSYPNMVLTTLTEDGVNVYRHELTPVEGYVLHNHAGCFLGDENFGIPAQCYYSRKAYFVPSFDLSTINTDYEAVLESSVPADNIYGAGDNNHEIA